MADLTLGNAIVSIGGDLGPLTAAFAQAKAMRDEFERGMVAGSSGLLNMKTAANDAGTALQAEADKAKQAGDAAAAAAAQTDQLTEAKRRGAAASKAEADALETEAARTKRLSDMIDQSIAKMNERSRVQATAQGRAVAGIGGGDAGLFARQTAMMSIDTKGVEATAAAALGTKVAAGAKTAETALKAEAKAVEEVGSKAHVSGGVMREFIVILREAGRGDFSRLAGSSTILATRLGVLEAVGAPLIITFALIAAAAGVLGLAYVKGADEAEKFDNMLRLSGNYAGLTANSYQAMAEKIGTATRTSVSANEELVSSLAKSNDFTAKQIGELTESAQRLAHATGESADDIVKDFAKMAEGPTKYAEAFQHAHVNIISPVQLQAIRDLEERGKKEEALALLIATVNAGIAANTQDTTNKISGWWEHATTTVSNYWAELKRAVSGSLTDLDKLGEIDQKIAFARRNGATLNNPDSGLLSTVGAGISNAFSSLRGAGASDLGDLERQRAAITDRIKEQEKQAEATAKTTQRTREQNDAVVRLHASYGGLIDNQHKFETDRAALIKTYEDAKAANPNDPLVKVLGADLPGAIERLRKQDLPQEFKDEAKAAREAESEAKKLARQAAELEARRQDAINNARDEANVLAAQIPLYRDRTLSLDAVNRAVAVQIALSRQKLDADSAEGRALALNIGRKHDENAVIEQQTKLRAAMEAFDKSAKDAVAAASGVTTPAEGVVAVERQDALDKVEKAYSAEFAIIGNAEKNKTKTHAEAEAERTAITAQAVKDRAYIETTSNEYETADAAIALRKLREEYGVGSADGSKARRNDKTTGADIHSLDQSLGGAFKQGDDLKALQDDIAKRKKIVADAQEAGIYSAEAAQKRLTAIERQGQDDRRKLQLETANMVISGGKSIADSLASIAADSLGKQSAAYKALFDVSKAFTIAQASLALYQDVAQALGKGFPQNIPLIAQAFAEGATIVSAVKSLNFASGGMIPGAGGGTQDNIPINASPGEYLINARSAAPWRPVLDAINSGKLPAPGSIPQAGNDNASGRALNVVIHDYVGVQHEVQRGPTMNDIVVTAKRIVAEDAPGVVARDMGKPNSETRKGVTTHFNTTARRK